jgi:hypothetical protein
MNKRIIAATAVLTVTLIAWFVFGHDPFGSTADRILLLVPDGVSFSDVRVAVWLDAGSEEGLHLMPVHDSDFVRPLFGQSRCAGIVLPDSVHGQASDPLSSSLHKFVADGGALMLVYDAGTLSLSGGYAHGRSRLSDLAGIDYALYDSLRDKTTQWSEVEGTSDVVSEFDIPPGKYYPFTADGQTSSPTSGSAAGVQRPFEVQLRRYKFGDLQYPSFTTSGNYAGRVLLHSAGGVVAGEHSFGRGKVFFVNLPLGYMKSNTDGLPLHACLKYFATHSLSLPYLTSVPDGVGGLVLNWHVDSNAALKPMQEINSWALLDQGPFSVHITAGPDAMAIGDKRGFDVEHNELSRGLIQQYVKLGYTIGSHGGWIHNYFAERVDKDSPADLEQYLVLNKHALEAVTGQPVVEYSAPNGNQPPWVTKWLAAHGFTAYYFTGDTGMGPTQGYRNGEREGNNIWAFPTVHLDRAAGFEEMSTEAYPDNEVEAWLNAVTEFAVDRQTVRLLYFHPPGILQYRELVKRWLENIAQLRRDGRFRWYTMTAMAAFLNSRKQIRWRMSNADGVATLEAFHPQSLEHAAWRLPTTRFADPRAVHGDARITRDKDAWIIVAGPGKELQVQSKVLRP